MQSRARTLPSTVLVAEAVDHAGLRRVLERGGYVGGNEREFYGKTDVFNHVTEQVLRFGSTAGAATYLRWLRAHSAQSLGAPRSITATATRGWGFHLPAAGLRVSHRDPDVPDRVAARQSSL